MDGNYTKSALISLAKDAHIKHYGKLTKHELAERLGIQLNEKKRPYKRGIEICKTNERFPSMAQAAKACGTFPAQLYAMVVNGEARFL